jgi:acylphosphatase
LNFEEMIIARKFIISGLVQGVGFRFFTQRSAARHQVWGYVRNLEDGRVEAVAQGDEQSVKAFMEDMTAGPTFARVEDIEETVLEPNGSFSAFLIEK